MNQQSIILRYKDGFDGFLTAVFVAYEEKFLHARIADETAPNDLFSRNITVMTDADKAQRVWRKLSQLWKAEGVRLVLKALIGADLTRDEVLFALIKYSLAHPNRWVLKDYACDAVLNIHQWLKRVQREAHRMKAFVRFSQQKDGVFYAAIAPDFPVLPLIVPFFAARFADQAWLIIDIKHGYGAYYQSGEKVILEKVDEPFTPSIVADNEVFYQNLWQTYFSAATIQERKNRRLNLQHIPLRYWQYLTEKQVLF